MKKFIPVLLASILNSFTIFAQSSGDYRSVGNGNWNDPSKWERYNGNSWVGSTVYPGQLSGAGAVTIMKGSEIKITASIPHPVASLSISTDNPTILNKGVLAFSAATAATLSVSGDVEIGGELRIDNQIGAKAHALIIGRNLNGLNNYDSNCGCYINGFQTINQDDKLGVTFYSTDSHCEINAGVLFQDITFNARGVLVNTNISIAGTATFINGLVIPGIKSTTTGLDILSEYDIAFFDGATISGASNVSHIDGPASKSGIEPFTFPIGHEGFYAPLTISGIAQPERFFGMYRKNSGWASGVITDPEIFSMSNCESWSLIRDVSNPVNSSIDVTVGWTSATRCGSSAYISNVSDVVLTTGFSHGGTGTGTTANGAVTWYGFNHLEDYHSITLGNVGTDCRTPFGLNSTNITSNSATISWSAVPGAASYDVEYSTNSSVLRTKVSTTTTSVNLTGLSPSVGYNCGVRANCSSSASSTYRMGGFTTLQAPPPPPPPVCNDVYETNNTSSQAKAISFGNTISAGITSTNDVDWFKVTTPNNANTNLDIRLSNLPADYDLYVYNKSLKLVSSSINSGTSNEVVIYNSTARKATYYIKVIGKGGIYNTSQCYNLLAQALSAGSRTTSHAAAPVNEVTGDPKNQLLYPNPASEFVQLSFNSTVDGQAAVQIFNVAGQLIKQPVIKIAKGFNQVKVTVNDVKQGMYLLKINKGELNMVRRFVIAR